LKKLTQYIDIIFLNPKIYIQTLATCRKSFSSLDGLYYGMGLCNEGFVPETGLRQMVRATNSRAWVNMGVFGGKMFFEIRETFIPCGYGAIVSIFYFIEEK